MNATAANLPHRLDRTVLIRATPDTVFRYFTDSVRWAQWWGAGSSIDPRAGGRMIIRYPNGIEAHGDVIDVQPPLRLTFSYGYASGSPIAAGASLVTITLAREGDDTRLHLTHAFDDAAVRDEHVQGWRYQLSVFANLVSDEAFALADERIDGWFEAWRLLDDTARATLLARVAISTVQFRDRFGTVEGVNELTAHIASVHRFMPGLLLQRTGVSRRCQETALVEWAARRPNGEDQARGTNVFVFTSSGNIASVTGFWHQNP